MWTRWVGVGGRWLLVRIVRPLGAAGVNPNVLTFLGFAVTLLAALCFAVGWFRWAAAGIFVSGFLDMLDGQVARRSNRVTPFGAFLDSTLDRYSDIMLYMGLVARYSIIGRFFYVILAAVAMASSFMVSYTRARAEALIPTCKVGFMERPERLVLLILGGAFNRMAPALWVIATIATATVIHRIAYTWRQIRDGNTLPAAGPGA
ncbi:MAG TPA: CDP-alcohol phosphatidyltransferase family protein [Candidatus Acidoferrales bacterium]|nr:CDP-alcohol phosphatidyltransferase family protein [Candidatus Acidoferrales bacterium]